jgi:hypothetical protein
MLTFYSGELQMSYLGVDLHSNSFTVCYRSKQGKQRIAVYGITKLDLKQAN